MPYNEGGSAPENDKKNHYRICIHLPNPQLAHKLKPNEDIPIYMSFFPEEIYSVFFRLFKGKKRYSGLDKVTDGIISADYLRFARIDVEYLRGNWSTKEHDCSIVTLIKFYLYRKIGLIHLSVLKEKCNHYIKKRRIKNLTKNPVISVIKGKFELYQAIMSDENVLSEGQFSEKQLADILFGYDYMVDISTFNLVDNALTWILEACVEDGELRETADGHYSITAKGIHYFTTTREAIQNRENINSLTLQQLKVQRSVSWLTYLLLLTALVTALSQAESACDGYDWLRERLSLDLMGQCTKSLKESD
ncbi:hypothetical protein [Alteromonas stellipolaris]|uniref:hypothetical protein n=1 Tax=Alteromonas stellipolaris TaxID=233316 RepID=UPI0012E827A2|nr:hypothetical protein [Alteromonas stellipolaris]